MLSLTTPFSSHEQSAGMTVYLENLFSRTRIAFPPFVALNDPYLSSIG